MLVHPGWPEALYPADVGRTIRWLKVDLMLPSNRVTDRRHATGKASLLGEKEEVVIGEVGERGGVRKCRAMDGKAHIAKETGCLEVVHKEQARADTAALNPLTGPDPPHPCRGSRGRLHRG